LFWWKLHVRAAPSHKKIHYVHNSVFIVLAISLSQLLSDSLQRLENCFARLAIGKETHDQTSKLVNWLARIQGLLDGLVNHRLHSLVTPRSDSLPKALRLR
jgi:hypothetical protein